VAASKRTRASRVQHAQRCASHDAAQRYAHSAYFATHQPLPMHMPRHTRPSPGSQAPVLGSRDTSVPVPRNTSRSPAARPSHTDVRAARTAAAPVVTGRPRAVASCGLLCRRRPAAKGEADGRSPPKAVQGRARRGCRNALPNSLLGAKALLPSAAMLEALDSNPPRTLLGSMHFNHSKPAQNVVLRRATEGLPKQPWGRER